MNFVIKEQASEVERFTNYPSVRAGLLTFPEPFYNTTETNETDEAFIMNHSNEIMPKDRITVMAKSKKDVHAMDEESYNESEWCYSMSSEHDDEVKRSKSDTTYGEASSKNNPPNSQRRSQSNTRQMQSSRKESRAIVQHAPRTPNTEPDLSIIVGDRDFHYFSQVIAYMSDYLSQQMVQIEDEKLRIDFSHKNAKEWEQFIYPLLEKHARSKRLTKSVRLINQSNLAVVLPWFQEFGMQELLHDSDELLASLPFVTPAIAGSSIDNDEHRNDVSCQDVQDAVSLLHIAFSCALPHTQTRAAELVHKYLQHSPKTWLLLDQQRSDEDEEDDDEEDGGTLSIFVQLAQVLQENPKCREFLFSRYSPNILEIYLPSEVFPCDKDSQSDWFWEEMVANPLFPFLLRERMKSFVRKMEQSQSPPQPVEIPTVEPEKPKPAVDPPASLSWQAMMSWIPSFQRPPTQPSRQLTEDEGDDEEDDYDEEEEDDDDSVINERSQLIHDVLDKIREPQHNFPRRPRSSTAMITIPSRRNLRLNGTIPPPMPVLHEQMASKEACGGDSVGTPVRVRKPTCSTVSASTTGSPSSAISNDMVSLSSASVTAPSVSSRRTFAC